MKEHPEVPAFRNKLVPHQEHAHKTHEGKLWQLEGRNDIVVRSLDWEKRISTGRFRPKEPGGISAEDFARITKRHFDELPAYGIRVAVSLVVAEKGDPSEKGPHEEVFAVTENIRQIQDPDKDVLGSEYVALRKALLRYYTDKFESTDSFLADLFNDRQYVYGTKEGDETPHLYLTDVDPFIYHQPIVLKKILGTLLENVEHERTYFDSKEYDPIIQGIKALLAKVEQAI